MYNNQKAIFLDRDGVINFERGEYNWKLNDFIINKGIFESLKIFHDNDYLLFIISNQGGIAKGIYTKDDVFNLHQYLNKKLALNNITLNEIYFCPHHPNIENCICRKPDSLLFEKTIAKYNIDVNQSYMFGDKERDVLAAEKVGIKGILIPPNENILKYCERIIKSKI